MPRATTKRAKTKMAKPKALEEQAPNASDSAPNASDGDLDASDGAPAATAVAEPPSDELQPPTTPVEMAEEAQPVTRAEQRDHIAASLNIAKLQAMSMNDLNAMARELGVENFGTMR